MGYGDSGAGAGSGSHIIKSHYPDVEVPDCAIVEFVLARARQRGTRVALKDHLTGEAISYERLADLVDERARGLAASGIGPGQVVALLSPNRPGFAVAMFAVLATGATVSPVSALASEHEIAAQLRASNCEVLIVADTLAATGARAAAAAGVGQVFSLGHVADLPPFDGLSGPPRAPVAVDPDAVAVLPFSSGTTGIPKGVQLSHRNIVANLVQLRVVTKVDPSETFCATLPFSHIYGLTVVLCLGILEGATIVTLPRFELKTFLEAVEKHRVGRLHVVPPIALALASAPEVDNYDLTSVWLVSSGAASLDAAVSQTIKLRLGAAVGQGYGMTEASPGITYVPDPLVDGFPLGTVGHLFAGTEARLVDPASGEDSQSNGELWVRGPQVMKGYLGAATESETGLVGDWLPTGDLASVDADGVFRIVGRIKELIKYNGYQVPPAELEALLLTHPAVIDAAVVGVADPAVGEKPVAAVVLAHDADLDEIAGHVNCQVAPYKKLRAITAVSRIPKSPSGKILRAELLRTLTSSDQAAARPDAVVTEKPATQAGMAS